MKNKLLLSALVLAMTALTGCSSKTEYIDSALQSVMSGDMEAVNSALETAEANGENQLLLLRAKGIASMGEGKYDDAIGYFEEALNLANGRLSETVFDIAQYMAVAEYKSGDSQAAIDTCTAICGLRPKDAAASFLKGELELEMGEYDSAVRDFNAVIEADIKNIDRYIDIYEALAKAGHEDVGMDYLDRASRIDVKLTDLQRGRLLYYQKEYEMARSFLEKARNNQGDAAIEYLGMCYEALGDMNYAVSLYQAIVEKNPSDAHMLNRLGMCQLQMGQYEEAKESFKKGLGVQTGELAQALNFNYITACEYLGEFEEAKNLMTEYQRRYPGDEAAHHEAVFLKTR